MRTSLTVLLVTSLLAIPALAQYDINPGQAKVNSDHSYIDTLTEQLDRDTKAKTPRETLKADKIALKTAKEKLKIDQRACTEELKASGAKVNPRLQSTTCK